MDPFEEYYLMSVLRLAAKYELSELFDWDAEEDGTISFYINVNDRFAWACADAEDITAEDLPELERAILDCQAADSCAAAYGPFLFVCRKRQMRPQGAAYPRCQEVWPLFDAAGPEREINSGNPKRAPTADEAPQS